MKTAKRIKCASCERRIPAHEPDIMLRNYDTGRVCYYHTRCGGSALQLAVSKPSVYVLTNRYVSGALN